MADMQFFRENIVVESSCEQIHTQHATQYATHTTQTKQKNSNTVSPYAERVSPKRKTAATNHNPKTNHTPCPHIDGQCCRMSMTRRAEIRSSDLLNSSSEIN